MSKKQISVKVLVLCAMLTALYVVLSLLAIRIDNNLRITADSLPIVVAGMLLGPVPGLAVGLLGNLIEQILLHGLGITTVLWIMADGVRGLLVGWYAKRKGYHLNHKQTIFITILAAIVATLLNTSAMYLDRVITNTSYLIWVWLPPRILTGVITSAVIGAVLPHLLKVLKRSLDA